MNTGKKRTRHTRLLRQDRLQRAFVAVAQAVSQTLDLQKLLDIALAKVLEVMDLDKGVIYLIDAEASQIVLKAHTGVSEEFVGAMGRMKVVEADIERWQEQREPAFGLERMVDQTTLAEVRGIIERGGVQSFVGTSLWSKEMLRGVMVLGSLSKRRFSPDELDLLDAMGNQIAVAIENAELFEQTRARAEELKASEAKYQRLVEDINDGYMVVRGNQVLFANKRVAEFLGTPLAEIIGGSFLQHLTPDSREKARQIYERTRRAEPPPEIEEFTLQRENGSSVPLEVRFKEITYEGERAYSMLLRDITERKQAEERWRLLSAAIDNSVDGIAMGNPEGMITYVNEAFARMFGYSKEELIGKEISFIYPEDEMPKLEEAVKATIGGGWTGELVGKKKDGELFPLAISSSVVMDDKGELIAQMASHQDITERKQAEEEIKDKAERLAVTAELTHIITSSLNIEDVYEAFTAGVRRLVDFDRASIALVEGDRLRLLAVSSTVATELEAGATIPLQGSVTEWIMENKRTNIETDFAQERQFPIDEAHLRSGLRSAIHLPLVSRGEVIGTFNLASRRPNAYGEREQEILEELAGQIAGAIENDRLYEEAKRRKEDLETAYEQLMAITRALERSKEELEEAYLKMARTLVLTLEARDPYTRGHSERVAQLSRQIAYEMRLPPEQIKKIETAARLHDLGKIGIPDGILLKPDSLTPSEWAEIQLHPTKSVDMLRFLGFLNGTLPMIEGHHERYDGRGYPDGLKGEETPRGARILAVADAYDAMTSARPYRPAMTSEQAIKILKEGAGTQWDPEVVDAFLRSFGRSLSEGENAD
ncbi:MAG: PAS domain S-box protein [Dehalococcoidia bacterium]|jgi:PAS domain S-box-containing protein|nr:PAS domain S-box protein [Dehalococcoidia bacterium]